MAQLGGIGIQEDLLADLPHTLMEVSHDPPDIGPIQLGVVYFLLVDVPYLDVGEILLGLLQRDLQEVIGDVILVLDLLAIIDVDVALVPIDADLGQHILGVGGGEAVLQTPPILVGLKQRIFQHLLDGGYIDLLCLVDLDQGIVETLDVKPPVELVALRIQYLLPRHICLHCLFLCSLYFARKRHFTILSTGMR